MGIWTINSEYGTWKEPCVDLGLKHLAVMVPECKLVFWYAAEYALNAGVVERFLNWSGAHQDRPLDQPNFLKKGYRVFLPRVKPPGRSVDHPPSSSSGVKERVDLYLISPTGASLPVLGRTWRNYTKDVFRMVDVYGTRRTKLGKRPEK